VYEKYSIIVYQHSCNITDEILITNIEWQTIMASTLNELGYIITELLIAGPAKFEMLKMTAIEAQDKRAAGSNKKARKLQPGLVFQIS
jgi:hypothetical protein